MTEGALLTTGRRGRDQGESRLGPVKTGARSAETEG